MCSVRSTTQNCFIGIKAVTICCHVQDIKNKTHLSDCTGFYWRNFHTNAWLTLLCSLRIRRDFGFLTTLLTILYYCFSNISMAPGATPHSIDLFMKVFNLILTCCFLRFPITLYLPRHFQPLLWLFKSSDMDGFQWTPKADLCHFNHYELTCVVGSEFTRSQHRATSQ